MSFVTDLVFWFYEAGKFVFAHVPSFVALVVKRFYVCFVLYVMLLPQSSFSAEHNFSSLSTH